MNELNFSEQKYKDIALNTIKMNIDNIHNPAEAFFLLINGIKKEDLSNLLKLIQQEYFNNDNNISLDECYKLTQNMDIEIEDKEFILKLAYKCIDKDKNLGNNIINNNINTSSWITHSLHAGKICSNLAKILNLNEDIANTLGLLHDYGRKFDHTFSHTIKGFEALIDNGYYNEALGCLTHSFIKGGRCANNDPSLEGFYVDDYGLPQWKPSTKKDDITYFLENYTYSDYDILLNISDLMEIDKPPYERIKDIATRREIDPTNRSYFLAEFTNVLIEFLKRTNTINKNIQNIKATKYTPLETIEKQFKIISDYFYNVYKK